VTVGLPREPAPDCRYGECDGSGFVVDPEARVTRECRCRPERLAKRRARRLSAVIPRRFEGVSFDRPPVTDMDPHVVGAVRRYIGDLDGNVDAGRGLWFMGDVGTGKTTLAMLVSKAALERRRSVAIYSVPRLLSELRKTFSDDAEVSYLNLIDSLTSVDLLHLDDVGAEKSSDWVLEQLYAIVNARYEEEKAIVVTTNLQPDALAAQITERTVSRLMEMCGDPLPLFGEDHRTVHEVPVLAPAPGAPLRYGQLPT
jgi:DNA replication protein DnaC